mgnify:FL=1
MEYRVLPHGGENVGIIGMGSSVIGAQPEEEIIATVRAAYESGVNYFDMAGGHAAIFDAYGKALEGIRDKVYLQIHFGADYTSGEYGIGGSGERYDLYCRCQREGVGITVMKPSCGGQLLDAAQSPFGVALTKAQCIQYALDKPGVIAVLPGFGNEQEMREVLACLDAPAEERDYSCLGELAPVGAVGRCVYCKHCHPCPAGLDIALINKYYDLAMQGDNPAREHYLTLEKRAGDCIGCGHCDSRCPFHVAQSRRMQDILAYFGA